MKKIYNVDLLAGTLKSVESSEASRVSEERQRALFLNEEQAKAYISKKLEVVADAGFGYLTPVLRQLLFGEEHTPGFWNRAASLIANYAVVLDPQEI